MRRYRRRRNPQYIVPFLILIGVVVVFVLALNLWSMLFGVTRGNAFLYLVEGRAKILPFGQAEWENSYNGAKLMIGDSVKTLGTGRSVIAFFDGTLLRMDADTEIAIVDIVKKSDYEEITLNLKKGRVWLNKPKITNLTSSEFRMRTDFAIYNVTGTVFALDKGIQEVLRVFKGGVKVDILKVDEGRSRVIENVQVGIGQEIVLDSAVMNAFYEFKNPSVLKEVSQLFKDEDWFKWNEKLDGLVIDFKNANEVKEKLAEFSKERFDLVSADKEVKEVVEISKDEDQMKEVIVDSFGDAVLKLDSNISNQINLKDANFTISGLAPKGAKVVFVKQVLAGSSISERYKLKQFDAKTLKWSYRLNAGFDNIRSGLNVYEFWAENEKGEKTLPIKVLVTLDKPKVVINENLVVPEVLKIGGKAFMEGMEVIGDLIVVEGSVEGAESISVNGYVLSKFKAGDKKWTYNLRENFGNLKVGENILRIEAVGSDGKREVKTVKFAYKKVADVSVSENDKKIEEKVLDVD